MSSVRVYFLVTHVVSGVSSSLYYSKSALNDAVFKQTVVSMTGYDSKLSDINIHSISDVKVVRRHLSAASTETTLVYSVTTPTRVFQDMTQATTSFIQALNESIVTGAFDATLRINAASVNTTTWLSVTTDNVIFSTAAPTSSPTSTPTSSPTKLNIINANLLAIELNVEVARAKVQYYLGAFVAYFLVIYICLYLYSFLRYGKLTATQLYDASYQSEVHMKHCANADSNNVAILSDLYRKNEIMQSTMRMEMDLKVVKQASSKKLQTWGEQETERKYSKGYREYVHQQRTLLGCSPFLYPDGYIVKIPCVNREVVFPPGRVENILLYICHNHPLFSCFYFMDGSKLGAHGTRILYIGKDVAVFVLYQFSNMLLQYLMLDGFGLGTFINLFIITPSAVSVGLLLKYLYTCPFTETVDFQRRYAKYETAVLLLGRLAIIPIMLIMCVSLFFACLFSTGHRVPMILFNYLISVQFYGILLAIVKTLLLFMDGYYYQLSLFGVFDLLCIGRLYKERILAEQLVVDVDYAYRINTYLFGVIRIQKILNRDDAIKAKWIKIGGDVSAGETYGIEMKGVDSIAYDETVISVQMNPLTEDVTQRSSVVFSMDGIFGASNHDDEEVGGYNNIYSSNSSNVATENPIHSLASMLDTVSLRPVTTRQESLQRQPSGIRINSETDAAVVVEDDAALYLEYQNLQDNHDDALYDLNDDSDVAMSFEEWKSRRKQFKQGTRGSFVR